MKFRKLLIVTLFLCGFLLSFTKVKAEECNPSEITIASIEKVSSEGKAEEVASPTVDGKKIALNLKMFDVGDSITYDMTIKNDSDEDYMIDDDSFKTDSKYIEYTLKTNDGNNAVKANDSKKVTLIINYKSEVEDSLFDRENKYDASNGLVLSLSTDGKEKKIDVIATDNIKNPKTNAYNVKTVLLIIVTFLIIAILTIKQKKKYGHLVLVISSILLIPVVYAVCKAEVKIESNIIITKTENVAGTLYWSLQDNDSDSINETLIISDHEIDGVLKGSFSDGVEFTNEKEVPWIDGSYFNTNNLSYDVSNVRIEGIVSPKSTAYWFYGVGYNASDFNANLSNLLTNKVTNMSHTFEHAGYKSTTFNLDLSNWDTSKVTNMSGLFAYAGLNATIWSVGNLSSWNTSKVTDMSRMFDYAGRDATTWSVGNLSGWNTSNVLDMSQMFDGAGHNSTTFNLDLSNWDTSKVTNMIYMFDDAGYKSTTFNLDLSNWDTSKVTNMSHMFEDAGCKATTWSIGDIGRWNTSNVLDMSHMFDDAGFESTTWSIGDLSNWDTSNVVDMSHMFAYAGRKEPSWSVGNLSSWNTSKVTNMSHMFDSAGYNSRSFNLNLSNWNTSKVTDMKDMFDFAGHLATDWQIIIPKTNGNSISNTTSEMYGSDTSIYAMPKSGQLFTIAN